MREVTIETYLVKRIKSLGGLALKFTSPGRLSVPDRIVIMPGGKLTFVELKRPGGVATIAQRREHERLRALGQEVMVVNSKELIDELWKPA